MFMVSIIISTSILLPLVRKEKKKKVKAGEPIKSINWFFGGSGFMDPSKCSVH